MNSNQGWQILLQEWLQTNPKVVSDDLSALHQQFLKQFPLEEISDLTYQDFVSESGYLFWITEKMGSLGNRVIIVDKYNETNKLVNGWAEAIKEFLVSLNKYCHIKENSKYIRDSFNSHVNAKIENPQDYILEKKRENILTVKLLYLYFPTSFLPILNHRYVIDFLKYFEQPSFEESWSWGKAFYDNNNRLAVFLQNQIERQFKFEVQHLEIYA